MDAPEPKAIKSSIEVLVDAPRNLIRAKYVGHISAAVMKAFAEGAAVQLSQMRKGFTMLTDLSSLDSMDLDCAPVLTKLMDLSRELGVATVVRIIPDPRKDIGLNILSIVHLKSGVHIVTCQNAEEAERAIGGLKAAV